MAPCRPETSSKDPQSSGGHVAQRVRDGRRALGLTLAEFVAQTRAAGIDLSETTLSKVERGTQPRYDRPGLVAISNGLGWGDDGIDLLLAGEEPRGAAPLRRLDLRDLFDRFELLESRLDLIETRLDALSDSD